MGKRKLLLTVLGVKRRSTILNDLVAYWKFDEASGNAIDATGRGNTLVDSNSSLGAAGVINNGRGLVSASTQSLSIANNADLQMGDISYTIWGWFKTATAGIEVAFAKTEDSNLDVGEYSLACINRTLSFKVAKSSGLAAEVSIPLAFTANTWVFIACRHDAVNNKASVQVNGGDPVYVDCTGSPDTSTTFSLYVGKRGSNQYYWNGVIDELGIAKKYLTDEELDQLYNGGAGLSYPFDWTGQIIFEGDSLTAGVGAAANLSYPIQTMSLFDSRHNGYKVTNSGLNGDTIANMLTTGAAIDALYNTAYLGNKVILWAGTNDIGTNEDEAATVHTNLSTWITARRAAGFYVIVLTVTPRNYAGDPAGTQTKIDALNVLMRADKCGAHVLVDVAANVNLDDPDDATYYGDALHMTAAGYAIVAEMVKAVLP